MPSGAYDQAAIANAVARGLTADDVQKYTYSQIAELAGVVLGPNGESPEDFFYTQVKQAVVQSLRDNAANALKEKQRTAIIACITLYPDLKGLALYDTDEGFIVK